MSTAATQSEPTHTAGFSASGNELAGFKQFLKSVRLGDHITHIEIKIEATGPIYDPSVLESEADESDDETTDDQQDTQTDDGQQEPSSDDERPTTPTKSYVCACGASFPHKQGFGGHKRHCEKSDDDDADRVPGEQPDSDDGPDHPDDEPAKHDRPDEKVTRLLKGRVELSEVAEEYDPDMEGKESLFKQVALNPDTTKWYVAGVLLRKQGRLRTTDIRKILEGTTIERDGNTISQAITELRNSGVVSKIEGEGWPQYQLTQFGRDCLKFKINQTKGYGMTAVDKATGVHPTA